MNALGSPGFRERLCKALDENQEFARETRWFDGSILLESGDAQCWLKVYRGRVIESFDHVPPLGYTFKIAGAPERWADLVEGRRLFADLSMPGWRDFRGDPKLERANAAAPAALRIEGNLMEAARIREALYHLADCVAASAR